MLIMAGIHSVKVGRALLTLAVMAFFVFSCSDTHYWKAPDASGDQCKKQMGVLKTTKEWKETLTQQNRARGCLQIARGQAKLEQVDTIWAEFAEDGSLYGFDSTKQSFITSIPLGIFPNNDTQLRRFRLFLFQKGLSELQQREICRIDMATLGYDCLNRSSTKNCLLYMEFRPSITSDAASGTVPIDGNDSASCMMFGNVDLTGRKPEKSIEPAPDKPEPIVQESVIEKIPEESVYRDASGPEEALPPEPPTKEKVPEKPLPPDGPVGPPVPQQIGTHCIPTVPLGEFTLSTTEITAIAIHPDGTRIALGNKVGLMQVWDVQSKQVLWKKQFGSTPIVDLAYSPKADYLAIIGDTAKTVHLYDTKTKLSKQKYSVSTKPLTSVAFSPNGKWILYAGLDTKVHIDTYPNKTLFKKFGYSAGIHSIAVSPDSSLVATGREDKTIVFWKLPSPTKPEAIPYKGLQTAVKNLSFSRDMQYMSGGEENGWGLWDVPTGKSFGSVLSINDKYIGAFHPKSYIFALGGKSTIQLRLAPGREILFTSLKYSGDDVTDLAFSREGTLLVTSWKSGKLRMWGCSGCVPRKVQTLQVSSPIKDIVIAPSGRWGLMSNSSASIEVWNLVQGKKETSIPKPHKGSYVKLAVSSNGKHFASGSSGPKVKVWDILTKREFRSWDLPLISGKTSQAHSIAFHPNGVVVAVGMASGHVYFYDTQQNKRFHDLKAHLGIVHDIAFSPDGKWFATVSQDGKLKFWDYQTKKVTKTTTPTKTPRRLAWSIDGKTVISASVAPGLEVWNVKTGARVTRLQHNGHIFSDVLFHYTGRYILASTVGASSNPRPIAVWNAITYQPLPELRGVHTGAINSIALSPLDGSLLSAGAKRILGIWKCPIP